MLDQCAAAAAVPSWVWIQCFSFSISSFNWTTFAADGFAEDDADAGGGEVAAPDGNDGGRDLVEQV